MLLDLNYNQNGQTNISREAEARPPTETATPATAPWSTRAVGLRCNRTNPVSASRHGQGYCTAELLGHFLRATKYVEYDDEYRIHVWHRE